MTLFFLPVSISVYLSLALWPEVLLPEDGALAPGQPLLLPAGCFGKTLCAGNAASSGNSLCVQGKSL